MVALFPQDRAGPDATFLTGTRGSCPCPFMFPPLLQSSPLELAGDTGKAERHREQRHLRRSRVRPMWPKPRSQASMKQVVPLSGIFQQSVGLRERGKDVFWLACRPDSGCFRTGLFVLGAKLRALIDTLWAKALSTLRGYLVWLGFLFLFLFSFPSLCPKSCYTHSGLYGCLE